MRRLKTSNLVQSTPALERSRSREIRRAQTHAGNKVEQIINNNNNEALRLTAGPQCHGVRLPLPRPSQPPRIAYAACDAAFPSTDHESYRPTFLETPCIAPRPGPSVLRLYHDPWVHEGDTHYSTDLYKACNLWSRYGFMSGELCNGHRLTLIAATSTRHTCATP